MEARSLQITREFAALNFSTWKLDPGLVRSQADQPLPSPPATAADGGGGAATDYVHQRAAALHNHLSPQRSGHFLFLRAAGGGLEVAQLHVGCSGGEPPRLEAVAALPAAAAPPGAELVDAPLSPTLAEVEGTDGHLLLVSSGAGDLRLLSRGIRSAAATPRVFPLRPPPPLAGARALQLEAAAEAGDGTIVAVAWAAAAPGRGPRAPSRCEVYALTLKYWSSDSEAVRFSLLGVQLLRSSALPPHGALAAPGTGAVLLAVDDSGEEVPRPAAAAAGADEGEDGGDASPRTLATAAARLAALTEDVGADEAGAPPAPDAPRFQYSDVFRESGPAGEGALGAEPACVLLTFSRGDSAPAAAAPDAAPLLSCTAALACQPHRLLACHRAPPGAPRAGLLLGLTDDVDAAVVEVSADESGGGFAARHAGTLPALAYVAAGKTRRKFLLLAPPPPPAGGSAEVGCAAAALVEAAHLAYVYARTAAADVTGRQQVVELGLGGGGGVLGAVLDGGRLVVLGGARLLACDLA